MRIGITEIIKLTFAACLLAVIAFLIACGSGQTTSGPANSPATSKDASVDRAGEIIAEALKRDAAPFRKQHVRFTIKADAEPAKIYEIDSWRKQTDAETTTLTQIISPAEDKGLGSLTLEAKDKKTVVVTYAASRDEFRETDTSKMFFGGLTAGELLGEWYKFDYRLLGEKDIAGVKSFELEGKIKVNMSSVVTRMTVLIRSDNYLPVELHLFDANDREIRTYRSAEFKNAGDRPYASRTEVNNPVYKAQITIEIMSREYPATIDDAMFAREKLKQMGGK